MNPEIRIYGPIGGGDENAITVKSISDQLNAIGEVDEIDVLINSDGGSVSQGIGIVQLLKKHPAQIHTIVQGGACSIAGYIACSGDTRTIEKDSIFHIHGPQVGTEGNLNDHEKSVELLRIATDSMASVYSALSGQTTDEIAEIFKTENYFSAEQAVELGYFTDIGDATPLAALINTNKFSVPERFDAALARRRSEPTPKDDDEMSKTSATLQDLKAKLKGASAEFLVAQLESEVSIDEAKDNFIKDLQAKNQKLQAKVDDAKAMEEEEEEVVAEEPEEEAVASGVTAEEILAVLQSMIDPGSEEMVAEEDEEAEAMEDDEAVAMDDEEVEASDEEEVTAELLSKIAARLQSKTVAKKKPVAKAKRTGKGRFKGARAVRTSTANASAVARVTATAHVKKLVDARMKETGKRKNEVIRAIFKEDPKLHDRYLAEANAAKN